jgi:SAM-dependent methyltransferase
MGTDKKTIAAYNEYAKKWTERKESGLNVAHNFLEKPAMYSKLPDLKNKTVLCVGCGSGEESFYLKSLGAKKVIGIDISNGLIEIAKKNHPKVEFHVMDMENINFPKETFDFVYSSLVMHYVKNWTKTLNSVKKVLKKNGTFLFSTHHPAVWSAERKRDENKRSSLLGYVKFPNENKCEIHGDYLNTRKIDDIWYDEFKVTYYHKSFSSIMNDIIKSGFKITDVLEPKALDKVKEKHKVFWEIRQKIPIFIIFELKKIE